MNCMKLSLLALCASSYGAGGRYPSIRDRDAVEPATLISGATALVEVRVPKNVSLNRVKLSLNGHDVTGAFTANASARTLRGVVSGLVEGRNDFAAGESRGGREARLVITTIRSADRCCSARRRRHGSARRPTPVADRATRRRRTRGGLTTTASTRSAISRQIPFVLPD